MRNLPGFHKKLPWQPGANTIAYWKFENNLNDSSGNQNDLTANAYSYSYVTGVDGYCCNSTVKQFGAESTITDSVFVGNFTLMFFVKFSQINSVARMMGCLNDCTNIQYESGQGGLQRYNNNESGRTSWSWSPVTDTRYHITITGDGTAYAAYLDGTAMTKIRQGNIAQKGQHFVLFNNVLLNDSNGMVGCLDEVIIEDKIWTQQDIQNYLAKFTY